MHQNMMDRWNSISLRTKITGVTVLLLTLGLLVSGIGTMAMLRPKLIDQLGDRTQTTLSNLLTSTNVAQNDSNESDYLLYVYDADGEIISAISSPSTTATAPSFGRPIDLQAGTELSANKSFQISSNNGKVEYVASAAIGYLATASQNVTVIVALPTSEADSIMATFLTIFLGFGVAIVIVGAMLTRLLVTTTFGPLREVERTAAAIAEGDFSQRLSSATPQNTEVGRLNRSLNTMLSRIDSAFRDRARTIDQMRRFVGDASHELRTPLVSVRGYAELYRMGALQTPEAVAQAMERIEKEAIRMGGLVEDLLELARLDESKPLALAPVDLMPLARDAAMDAMASWPDREFSVVTRDATPEDYDAAPPPPPEPVVAAAERAAARPAGGAVASNSTGPISFAATFARLRSLRARRTDAPASVSSGSGSVLPEHVMPAMVMAEENKIRQVLTNLIGNAVRYTDDTTPVEIGVAVDRADRIALLEVIDHGEGIPPQIREKIFQRFWRADTSRTRETGGSGLGLAIVSSIVAAHRGSVDVVETPGGGATFRVALPLLTMTPNVQSSTDRPPQPE